VSEAERKEGARLIEEKIRESFLSAGKVVENIQWNIDKGEQLLEYSSHTIHITVGGKELKLANVPNERVEDYPGSVGNEILDAHIIQLAGQ